MEQFSSQNQHYHHTDQDVLQWRTAPQAVSAWNLRQPALPRTKLPQRKLPPDY